MGLSPTQLADLVLETQNKMVQRGAFVNMQTDITKFIAVREMWDRRKTRFAGGLNWEFAVQMDHNHSAKAVGLYQTDGSAMTDTMVNGTVPPRFYNAHYVYDLREPSLQQGGTAIVDFLVTKYSGMMVSWFETIEAALWSKPTDSNDTLKLFGLQYWITRSAAEGFSGGNPSGFTSGKAGISQSTYARWANWSNTYTAVSKVDLIRSMRKAHREIQFESPLSHAEPTFKTGNGIYMPSDTLGLFEEALEDQNMNLGNDVASKDGRAMFKGSPLVYAPKLDADAAEPIYMIDWKWFTIGVVPGWESKMTPPYPVADMHNVRRVDLDASLNTICTDLRRQAVFYKA